MPPASRRLRILITADAIGGVWTHVRTLVEALSPAVDFTVAVLGPAAPPPLPEDWPAAVHHCPSRLEWMEAPWSDVRASATWLRDLSRTVAPDVVHVNGYAHAAIDFSAPVLLGAHSCVCSWWRAVHAETAPDYWNVYRTHVRLGIEAASLVVAPSAVMLQMLRHEHGSLGETAVVHNGAPPARHRAIKSPLIVAVGRAWDEAKNLQVLDLVAPDLPWPIVVLGATDGPGESARALRSLHTLGAQPASVVREWLDRASVFAHPARYEPFGLAALEAAQAGCALVLADIPSLREIWGEAAVYVDPDDSRGWQRALSSLAAAPAEVARLGQAARRLARRYSAAAMARAYHHLYAQLAAQPLREVAGHTRVWSAARRSPGAPPGVQPGASA